MLNLLYSKFLLLHKNIFMKIFTSLDFRRTGDYYGVACRGFLDVAPKCEFSL